MIGILKTVSGLSRRHLPPFCICDVRNKISLSFFQLLVSFENNLSVGQKIYTFVPKLSKSGQINREFLK